MLRTAASMGGTALRPWPSGKKVKAVNNSVRFIDVSRHVFHLNSILHAPLQTCTHMATARHMMTSIWWCAATVGRWWSLKPSRSTARGGMGPSTRCVASRLLRLHSSDLALAALLQVFPPLERSRRMADVMRPVPPPRQHHLPTHTSPPRPRRRRWGTVVRLFLCHNNTGKVNYVDLWDAQLEECSPVCTLFFIGALLKQLLEL